MRTLADALLSVKASGSVVEVGCNQGWTSAFLLETMKDAKVERPFVGIDTFQGFLTQDIKIEHDRGNPDGYAGYFLTCKRQWYEHSLARNGYSDVTALEADCSVVDYSNFAPIAFMLLDVDIYRPTKIALEQAWPCIASGGIVIVDDCDPTHELWNGAHQAYQEFCAAQHMRTEIVCSKLGILRKS